MNSNKSIFILLLFAVLSLTSAMQISKEKAVTIVHGANASDVEREAATELQIYISRICGAQCAIRTEGDSISGPTIYVGETEYAKRAIPDYAQLGKEEWVIKNVGDDLVIGGGHPRGVIYGVYEFLEKLGVVWPNELMEYVPKMDEILVTGLDIREKPAFMLRHIYSGLYPPTQSVLRYFVRNKMNRGYNYPAKLGGFIRYGKPAAGHTFHKYSMPDWPDEYFALNEKGERPRSTSGKGPGQLCLTHPGLRKAMVARLREFIKSDRESIPKEEWPFIYVVGMNDNKNRCLCETCKKRAEEEGSYSGPMLELVNYMANDIAKDYPDIFIRTSAYSWALKTPKTVKPAPNVIIHLCKTGCEFYPSGQADTLVDYMHPRNKSYLDNYLEWLKIAKYTDAYDYWIIYQKLLNAPYLSTRSICRDIKFYYDHNALAVSTECERPLDTCFYHLKIWLGLKAMQNPNMDYDTTVERFCRASYGPAAAPMKELSDYIQERHRQADFAVGRSDTIVKRTFVDFTPNPNLPDILPYTDRAFYEKANALLDEAETLVQEMPDYLACVRRERIPIDNALLSTYTKYMEDPPSGRLIPKTYKALYDRNEANYIAQAEFFYKQAYNNEKTYKQLLNEIKIDRLVAFGDKESMPEELRARNTKIVPCSSFKTVNGSMLIDDPEAFGGRTAMLEKSKRDNYYRIPHEMGVHASDTKQKLARLKLEEKDIPQDEKYHLYHFGRVTITPMTKVWFHWTWLIYANIGGNFIPDGNNEWDVYVSLKLTGEPYVKGSQTETGVYCDRVILAK